MTNMMGCTAGQGFIYPASGHTGSLRKSPFAGLNPEIPNDLTGDE